MWLLSCSRMQTLTSPCDLQDEWAGHANVRTCESLDHPFEYAVACNRWWRMKCMIFVRTKVSVKGYSYGFDFVCAGQIAILFTYPNDKVCFFSCLSVMSYSPVIILLCVDKLFIMVRMVFVCTRRDVCTTSKRMLVECYWYCTHTHTGTECCAFE